jgi:hypothetical protein
MIKATKRLLTKKKRMKVVEQQLQTMSMTIKEEMLMQAIS